MRTLALTVAATSLALPGAAVLPTAKANAATAQKRHRHHQRRHARHIKKWRGDDGHWHCRKPDGTTGLLIGGVAGALVGRTVDTQGDRTAGTVVGGVAGALAGREIERGGERCK